MPYKDIYYHTYKPRMPHPVLNHHQEEHVNTMLNMKIIGLKWRIFWRNRTGHS